MYISPSLSLYIFIKNDLNVLPRIPCRHTLAHTHAHVRDGAKQQDKYMNSESPNVILENSEDIFYVFFVMHLLSLKGS